MYKLAEHQEYALFMMDTNPSLGLFYDMGTGKTMIALAWIYRALQDGRIQTALVICPASLVPNWEDSIDKMAQFEGFTAEGIEMVRKCTTITSYQRVYRSKKVPTVHRDGQTTFRHSIELRAEVDRQWGAVIVDESHNLGAHDAIQTKAVLVLARLARYRYIMTATPVHGGKGQENMSKLYGQISFLQPDIWANWTQFCQRYVTAYDRWHKPISYNLPSCRALMRNHAIVCRLEDCVDMPEKTETVVKCPLLAKQPYKDISDGNGERYGVDIEMAGSRYTKLLQLCSGSMKVSENEADTLTFECSKDEALEDILNGTKDKVVVFCNYRASVDRCAAICRKAGRKTVVFDGRSKGPTWKDFQQGDAEAIVCQFASGGPGLDLFASAHMVMYEPTRSALLLTQSTGRIYRKGQTNRCEYFYLTTPGTLEVKTWDAVRRGVDVTDQMLENWAHGIDDI